VDVTRRPTGGGGIYHDYYGDISYSIIAPADELPGSLLDAYHLLCEPLFTALRSIGVNASYAESEQPGIYPPACYLRELHPAHDVMLDGQKLSGNAQYRQRDAIIQHGSLSFALDPERHLLGFADPPSIDTFRDRVGAVADAVELNREAVVTAVEEAYAAWADARPGSWDSAELETAESLAARKYRDESWIRSANDPT
jgi:lipoate-protein ligase A